MKTKRYPEIVAAAMTGDLAGIRAAVVEASDTNRKDRDGRTALHHAAINGSVDVAALLLSLGADVDAPDDAGWTPLHFAAARHQLRVAELLLDAGAQINPEDEHGNTPLSKAVFESRGRGEMITFLLQRGADRTRANRYGVTPEGLARTIANYDVRQWFRE